MLVLGAFPSGDPRGDYEDSMRYPISKVYLESKYDDSSTRPLARRIFPRLCYPTVCAYNPNPPNQAGSASD